MVIAVAGGPPGGDAVDQFAPVGEHDTAAMRCARPASGGGRGLHLRIGQPECRAGRIPIGGPRSGLRLKSAAIFVAMQTFTASLRSVCFEFCPGRRHEGSKGLILCLSLLGRVRSTTSRAKNSAELDQKHSAARSSKPAARRRLGGARRAASAVILVQRLSRSTHHPAMMDAAVAATRQHGVGPAPRGWSPAITRCSPSWRRGSHGSRRPRRPACSAPVIWRISASSRHSSDRRPHSGRRIAHACLWAGARLARGNMLAFRHNDVAHAEALLAQASRAHAHALVVTDGVFSMDGDLAPLHELAALAQRYDAWLLADERMASAWWAAVAARPSRGGARPTCRCRWARCRRRSAPMAAIVRHAAGHRPDPEPRPHLDLFHRPAAGGRRRRDCRSRPDRTEPRFAPAVRQGSGIHRAGLPEAQSAIVPVVIGERGRSPPRVANAGRGRIPGRSHPAADRPAGTARLRLTFRPLIRTPRSSASPISCARAVLR